MAKKKGKNEEWVTRKMEMWVARDKDYKGLHLFSEQPVETLWGEFVPQHYEEERVPLPFLWFDDIVFENSPVKIEMRMKILVPKEGY